MTDEAITRPLGRIDDALFLFFFFSRSNNNCHGNSRVAFFNITSPLFYVAKTPSGLLTLRARSRPISPDVVRRWPNAGRSWPTLPEDRSLRYQQQRRRFGRATFGSCICPDLRTIRRITNANALRRTRPTRNTTRLRDGNRTRGAAPLLLRHTARFAEHSKNYASYSSFSYRSTFSTVSKFPVLRRTRKYKVCSSFRNNG